MSAGLLSPPAATPAPLDLSPLPSAVPGAAGVSTGAPALFDPVSGRLRPPQAVPDHGPGAGLDLHEGICDPPQFEDWRDGCKRWPAGFLLRWRRGELSGYVEGRCKATNLCPYCRIMGVIETAEMLWLDAAEWAPNLWIVLTAREHLQRADTYDHLRQIRRSVKKRWPAAEWFVQVEFQKRGALHLNLLLKGVPTDEAEQLLEHVSRIWCRRVDAEPVGQHIEAMSTAQAVVRYLQKELSHGLKQEQAPPIGWRGHRTSQTRGYLVRPASEMREEARESLRVKRTLWRIRKENPAASAEQVEQMVADRLAQMDATVWELVIFTPKRAEEILAAAGLTRAGPPGQTRAEKQPQEHRGEAALAPA